mmetsp:Transcript_43159/g.116610  ORF Transcript_43159/g.116610 Transcript_43159/m.116610 type:complete len:223 (+) Transcript_43159:1774-2442(+)
MLSGDEAEPGLEWGWGLLPGTLPSGANTRLVPLIVRPPELERRNSMGERPSIMLLFSPHFSSASPVFAPSLPPAPFAAPKPSSEFFCIGDAAMDSNGSFSPTPSADAGLTPTPPMGSSTTPTDSLRAREARPFELPLVGDGDCDPLFSGLTSVFGTALPISVSILARSPISSCASVSSDPFRATPRRGAPPSPSPDLPFASLSVSAATSRSISEASLTSLSL